MNSRDTTCARLDPTPTPTPANPQEASNLCDQLITTVCLRPLQQQQHCRHQQAPHKAHKRDGRWPHGGDEAAAAVALAQRLEKLDSLSLLGFTAPQLASWLRGPLGNEALLAAVQQLELELQADEDDHEDGARSAAGAPAAVHSTEGAVKMLPGLRRVSFTGATLPAALGAVLGRSCAQLSRLELHLRAEPSAAACSRGSCRDGRPAQQRRWRDAATAAPVASPDAVEGLLLGLAGGPPALESLSVGPAPGDERINSSALVTQQRFAALGALSQLTSLEWGLSWSWALLPSLSAGLGRLTSLTLASWPSDESSGPAPGLLAGCFPALTELHLLDQRLNDDLWANVLAQLPALTAVTCCGFHITKAGGELEPLPGVTRFSLGASFGCTLGRLLRLLRALPGLQAVGVAKVLVERDPYSSSLPGVVTLADDVTLLHDRLFALAPRSPTPPRPALCFESSVVAGVKSQLQPLLAALDGPLPHFRALHASGYDDLGDAVQLQALLSNRLQRIEDVSLASVAVSPAHLAAIADALPCMRSVKLHLCTGVKPADVAALARRLAVRAPARASSCGGASSRGASPASSPRQLPLLLDGAAPAGAPAGFCCWSIHAGGAADGTPYSAWLELAPGVAQLGALLRARAPREVLLMRADDVPEPALRSLAAQLPPAERQVMVCCRRNGSLPDAHALLRLASGLAGASGAYAVDAVACRELMTSTPAAEPATAWSLLPKWAALEEVCRQDTCASTLVVRIRPSDAPFA